MGDWYSYHAMLVALCNGSRWDEALSTFEDMKRSSKTKPDESCYRVMLRVCASVGLAEPVG